MNAHTNEYIQKKGVGYQIPGWCQGELDNLSKLPQTGNLPEDTRKVDDDK